MTFSYRGIDGYGAERFGSIDGESPAAAERRLKILGFREIYLAPQEDPPAPSGLPLPKLISRWNILPSRSDILRQLAQRAYESVPLAANLAEAEACAGAFYKAAIRRARLAAEGAASLEEALATTGWFTSPLDSLAQTQLSPELKFRLLAQVLERSGGDFGGVGIIWCLLLLTNLFTRSNWRIELKAALAVALLLLYCIVPVLRSRGVMRRLLATPPESAARVEDWKRDVLDHVETHTAIVVGLFLLSVVAAVWLGIARGWIR